MQAEESSRHYSPASVCCRAYYDKVGVQSQQIRMAKIMNLVKFVDQDGNEVADPKQRSTHDE